MIPVVEARDPYEWCPLMRLDPRLQADCIEVGRFALCRLLLLDDSRYPWFILVPDRDGLRELHELQESDAMQFMRESRLLSKAMIAAYQPDKLNIGALGNLVAQLHVHHVARFQTDPAWPGPVWGHSPAVPYGEAQLAARVGILRSTLPQGVDWAAYPGRQ